MDPVPPVLIVIIIIAIGAGIYIAWQNDRKRREALLLWASGRGWNFLPGKAGAMHHEFSGLKVFQKGHSRSAKNLIKGEFQGRPMTLMDYRYVVGHGKNRSTHNRGVPFCTAIFPPFRCSSAGKARWTGWGNFLEPTTSISNPRNSAASSM